MRSHINWREERVPARRLSPEGVDWGVPLQLEKKERVSARTLALKRGEL